MGYVEQMVNEHVVSGTGRRLKLGPVTGRNPHQTLALGRKRQIQHEKYGNPNTRFAAMASLYLFDPQFCNVASGWEKGVVEKNVQDSPMAASRMA